MNRETNLAYEISRDLSHLFCDIHHIGLSSPTAKVNTVVKVCCSYFRDEVEQKLKNKYGNDFVTKNIRVQLPSISSFAISSGGATAEE